MHYEVVVFKNKFMINIRKHDYIYYILDDCTKEDGARCINGACLNGVCYCNDGFGGCNCQELGKLFSIIHN